MQRRQFLQAGTLAAAAQQAAAATLIHPRPSGAPQNKSLDVRYCLNTSTIREQTEDIVKHIEIAAEAGYSALEPWMRNIQAYKDAGGSMQDLKKRLDDAGLTVESAIGFAQWIVDDETQRTQGLEDAKRDMDLLAELGGKRIAAPPVGAHRRDAEKIDLFKAAERYRALLEIGDQTGVTPQMEVWGFSPNLSRLGESVFVCIESGHPKACLLPDVYHIFKGGSNFEGLSLLSDDAVQVFHMNDYPAEPARG